MPTHEPDFSLSDWMENWETLNTDFADEVPAADQTREARPYDSYLEI
jgi:hypothetical protein